MKPKIFKSYDGYIVECGDAEIYFDLNGVIDGGGVLDEPRNSEGININDLPIAVAAGIVKATGWRVKLPKDVEVSVG